MAKPKPVPPYFLFISTEPCEKLSKIELCFSIGIPIPVSAISKCTVEISFSVFTTDAPILTFPFLVNFKALLMRLMKICESFVGSPIKWSGIFSSISKIN